MMNDKIFTISNMLSILRVLLIVPVILIYQSDLPYHREWAIVIIVIAMVTDALDGYLARIRNEVSELGKIVDPLADKICIGLIVLMLGLTGELSWWYILLILGRDFLILIGGMIIKAKKKMILTSTMTGKITVTILAMTLLLVILGNPQFKDIFTILFWSSIVMMGYSFSQYTYRFYSVFTMK
jgi:CDP-diacylglycerol--glycerol-3-phosphate 3-phosphatidyltransferase